ncbi:serine/threonine-protein kinase HAL4/sat4 [Mycoemilia scoparia]|uniref:non-specific serine/threonine protein kinase n=1 Tax=Mycoemilia scoparia TaxID=417184 RepID=A0A9W8A5D7_9FUNG|nr:serine/threonine-protein kinase HAL4/sat4 [Mycoemilia scoparia]
MKSTDNPHYNPQLSPTPTLTQQPSSRHRRKRWSIRATQGFRKFFGLEKNAKDNSKKHHYHHQHQQQQQQQQHPHHQSHDSRKKSMSSMEDIDNELLVEHVVVASHFSQSSHASDTTQVEGELVRWAESGYIKERYGPAVKAIGQGTGGIVHLHINGRRQFAVKKFQFPNKNGGGPRNGTHSTSSTKMEPEITPSQWKHLLDEAHFSLSLQHPCIIHTLEFVREANNSVYSVMEFCNKDLFAVIQSAPPIPDHPEQALTDERASFFFYQLISAMAYLHCKARVTHRDIKLDNICVDDADVIRVIDFGCSAEWPEDEVPFANDVCGSNPYIAPEVFKVRHIRNYSYDPRPVDIWAMAIVFIAMKTGHFPWEIATPTDPNYSLYIEHRGRVIDHWVKPSHPANKLIKDMLSIDSRLRPNIEQILEYDWVDGLRKKYSDHIKEPSMLTNTKSNSMTLTSQSSFQEAIMMASSPQKTHHSVVPECSFPESPIQILNY